MRTQRLNRRRWLAFVAALPLAACEPTKALVEDLRRANPYSDIHDQGAENPGADVRRSYAEPQCWWDQSYQTVCTRAPLGGGQVCRPVPAGQPVLRCIGASPQFPFR